MRIINIKSAKQLAKLYHDEDTYQHTRRVAKFVQNDQVIPENLRNDCIALAYLHDLLEDTDFAESKAYKELPEPVKSALLIITKPEDVSYDDYCAKIKASTKTVAGKCAWYVKMADMKDHLTKTDTLTDRLKEKYLSGLRFLL